MQLVFFCKGARKFSRADTARHGAILAALSAASVPRRRCIPGRHSQHTHLTSHDGVHRSATFSLFHTCGRACDACSRQTAALDIQASRCRASSHHCHQQHPVATAPRALPPFPPASAHCHAPTYSSRAACVRSVRGKRSVLHRRLKTSAASPDECITLVCGAGDERGGRPGR